MFDLAICVLYATVALSEVPYHSPIGLGGIFRINRRMDNASISKIYIQRNNIVVNKNKRYYYI